MSDKMDLVYDILVLTAIMASTIVGRYVLLWFFGSLAAQGWRPSKNGHQKKGNQKVGEVNPFSQFDPHSDGSPRTRNTKSNYFNTLLEDEPENGDYFGDVESLVWRTPRDVSPAPSTSGGISGDSIPYKKWKKALIVTEVNPFSCAFSDNATPHLFSEQENVLPARPLPEVAEPVLPVESNEGARALPEVPPQSGSYSTRPSTVASPRVATRQSNKRSRKGLFKCHICNTASSNPSRNLTRNR